ncbi:MAG TPA: LPXTG cell wall anchor domain-containing protein [Actinospica sp.]|jgi:LPXTG-motif cell wall-anchored protein|nr:LPXTG cell wall anchor domain-containing protein [Actinospica sp.]
MYAPAAIDPTNHGSNFPVVAVLAVGILLLIGLLVLLLTRRR